MNYRIPAAVLAFMLSICAVAMADSKQELPNVLDKGFLSGPSSSTLHFRPATGSLGDVIPFYWQGIYHVFYLHGSAWGHLATQDFVYWHEWPDALDKGGPESPDGENCWTGSIVEHHGLFHLFYTGKNSADPRGDQKVMHATSKDLIEWAKQDKDTFYADGSIYWSKPVNGPIDDKQIYHHQAFRDPEVSWMPAEKRWWLLLHAVAADGSSPVFARFTSDDLTQWQPSAPLLVFPKTFSGDCPQLFSENGKWYIIAADRHYTRADALGGFYNPEMVPYETGELFVPKTMFDGKRRILLGWIGDRKDAKDAGEGVWGGVMSMARELYADADGRLCERPAAEVVKAFDHRVIDSPDGPASGTKLNVPNDYMLHTRLVGAAPGAKAEFAFREQSNGNAYRLSIDFDTREIALSDSHRTYKRVCDFAPFEPFDIRAFVVGTVIECFINDAYCFTMRAYDHPGGTFGFNGTGGILAAHDFTLSERKK